MNTIVSSFFTNVNKIFILNNRLNFNFLFKPTILNTLFRFNFIVLYLIRNENLWLDGFLFDFLQKKTVDL